MDSNFINIDLEHIDDIHHLEVQSDEHEGDPKRDYDLADRVETRILDNADRSTAFGGDMFNNIMHWDKRYTIEEGNPMPSLTTEVTTWEEHHKELFKVHKDNLANGKNPKIWYGLAGNHEYMDKHIDHAWMNNLFTPKDIKYLGSKGWVGLQISHNDKPLRRWKLFVAHGFGGGGNLEKPLQDMKVNNYADVFLMGHLHRKFITTEIVYDYSFAEQDYVEREIVLGNTGTFANSVLKGRDSWWEHRNKSVQSKPGNITVSSDAYNGKLSCHL